MGITEITRKGQPMLNDKIALVTGATRHTGYDIAAELRLQGAIVYVNGRDEAAVSAVVKRLGPGTRPALADLADEAQVRHMMKALLSEAGRIDLLVNNACHLGIGPDFIDTPLALLDDVLAVNLRAVFLLSQLAAIDMSTRGEGCIVNIGSNTAERPIRRRSAYIASKGALDALTRAMAVELAPRGIRVNAIAAGYIHTTRWDALDDATRVRRRANVPLGREATGADIGRAVVFLASDMSGSIVGARLAVDGGTSTQLYPLDVEA